MHESGRGCIFLNASFCLLMRLVERTWEQPLRVLGGPARKSNARRRCPRIVQFRQHLGTKNRCHAKFFYSFENNRLRRFGRFCGVRFSFKERNDVLLWETFELMEDY